LVIVGVWLVLYLLAYRHEQACYCRALRDYTNRRPEFFSCFDCTCERGASKDCTSKEERVDDYYSGVTENSTLHREQPWYITMPYDQFDITYYRDKVLT